MLSFILNKLRNELTPLVQAELRSKLEPQIRAQLIEDINRKVDQESLQQATSSLAVTLKDFRDTIRDDMRTLWSEAKKEFSESFQRSPSELTEGIASKLDTLIATRVEPLRKELADRLEPKVREELQRKFEPDVIRGLQREASRMHQAEVEKRLLNYIATAPDQDINVFFRHLSAPVRASIETRLRDSLSPTVQQLLRAELRPTLIESVRNELKEDPQVKTQALAQAKQEMASAARSELEEEIRKNATPQIRQELQRELRLQLVLGNDGLVDGTIAALIKKHLQATKDEMQQATLDLVWDTVSRAILEAFGAANARNEPTYEEAIEAAVASFKPSNTSQEERLVSAIENALFVFGLHAPLTEQNWQSYCELARSLVDDRIRPHKASMPKTSFLPSGFFKATGPTKCDLTQEPIFPGELYVTISGTQIRLPSRQDPIPEHFSTGDNVSPIPSPLAIQ